MDNAGKKKIKHNKGPDKHCLLNRTPRRKIQKVELECMKSMSGVLVGGGLV